MIRILQKDNAFTKAIFALIIGATIILMVLFLVPGFFDNGAANDASLFATVKEPGWWGRLTGESTPIHMQDVQRAAQQMMAQQGLPPSVPDIYKQIFVQRAGQMEVERAILMHEADRLGLQVTDDDLASFFKTGAFSQVLFPNGQFVGQDKYEQFIMQQYGMGVQQFETLLKADLEFQRLRDFVTSGVTVSDAAVRADYLKTGTKVKFDYAVISADDVRKTINPTDDQLQAFFKQNAGRYATAVPETRKISFFAFDASQVPGGAPQISDQEIQNYYSQNQSQYKVEAQVQTRHILISVPAGADAKTDAAAKAKAEDVLKQIKAGGNFAELAKKYSDDPGSKDKGGELPMIPAAQLDPAYAKAALALNPGQTSDLVRSQFGYHIIQTENKQIEGVKPLAEVKDQIRTALQTQKQGAALQNYANQLASEAAKNGLDKTAAAHGLHVTTTDFISPSDVVPSLPDSTQLVKAAFAAPKGGAPTAAPTGEGFAIFQVTDIQPAHAPTFDAYKANILNDYRAQQTPQLLNAQLIKLSDRAKALGDLKKAAAEMHVTVKSSDLVGRDAQVPDIGALTGPASVIFTMNKGGITGPIDEGPNGSVLQLTDKQEPTPDDIAKNLPATRDKLLQQQRAEVFEVFAGTLIDKYNKSGAVVYSKKQQPGPGPFGPGL